MQVKFWGVRGSIPVPEADKLKVGGNTSCVEVLTDSGKRLILDAGTGIRAVGHAVSQELQKGVNQDIILLLSHTHWDHIQGLTFFTPLFNQAATIRIYGPARANRKLEQLISGQMEYDYWPIKLSQLPCNLKFFELKEGIYTFDDGLKITSKRHIHPGGAFGYRIEAEGKTVVYCTDTEHFQNQVDKRVVELSADADVLIHDSQYMDNEMEFKLGWGHSSWQQCVQVANEARVKTLVLFHHDPMRTDDACVEIENQAKAARAGTLLSREGMVLKV